ncbi:MULTISPECIES: aldo/keto reductase [Arenibacter]|uniref:aldo/keto reductase n=1 Tax=Arenibacter TaxID=178469 RepID=UPI0004DF1805|nr:MULTISPECIES: aldo/keto reductase [Arenibacter]GBF19432.1 general stress protein 69 [Arenibacter sp. NBRC 103722]
MEYRKLGSTDLEVSSITFGAWAAGGWMWGGSDTNDAIQAIRSAYDQGVTSIDTAPVYGQGASEEIVGEAIKDLPRDKVQILTKFGLRWDIANGDFHFHSKDNLGNDIDIYKYASKKSIIKEVEDSLKRLRTDYIDLYQIHWPDTSTRIQETFEAVAQLIEDGKVRFAGVCNYNIDQMKEAEKYVNLASNQLPFSMVNKGIENEIVPYCIKNNKSILAYSPLERGLLTGKMRPGQSFDQGDHRANNPFFSQQSIVKTNAFLEKIRPIANDKGATLAQLVLKWTLERPGITIALVGARNETQSIQNAVATTFDLSPDELYFINLELEKI